MKEKNTAQNNDGWMTRASAHHAMTCLVNFLVTKDKPKRCVAIRVKETGLEIKEGDPILKDFLGDNFANLQEACFYDFGKDIEDSVKRSKQDRE